MTDAERSELRQKAHLSFDRVWRTGKMTRGQAYRWLARELKVPEPEAHMGVMVSRERLLRVIEVSDAYMGRTLIDEDFASEPPLPPL